MNTCRLCQSEKLSTVLDFGQQPICNRFLPSPEAIEEHFPLTLLQCHACGLLQLLDPAPASEVTPPYNWISYVEAEGHLDETVSALLDAVALPPEAKVTGITYKDASVLQRLRQTGHTHVRVLDPETDLAETSATSGMETIQAQLTSERARAIVDREGPADLVVARHIWEHAHDLRGFAAALRDLLRPGGYALIEIPDFTVALESYDYSTLWEEHVSYFTPATFSQSFSHVGFRVLAQMNFPYPLENSLVVVAQRQDETTPAPLDSDALSSEIEKAERYAVSFPQRKKQVEEILTAQAADAGPIAMFGAGHLACTFINVFGLKSYIEFVVDDNPHKQGLFMPGSRLPIRGSDALYIEKVRFCLSSLNPESEARVRAAQQHFIDGGGLFASIFPANPRGLEQLAGRGTA